MARDYNGYEGRLQYNNDLKYLMDNGYSYENADQLLRGGMDQQQQAPSDLQQIYSKKFNDIQYLKNNGYTDDQAVAYLDQQQGAGTVLGNAMQEQNQGYGYNWIEQAILEQKRLYEEAQRNGDQQGMQDAHNQAEYLRRMAGERGTDIRGQLASGDAANYETARRSLYGN